MAVIRDIFGFSSNSNPGESIIRSCAPCCTNVEASGWDGVPDSEEDDS